MDEIIKKTVRKYITEAYYKKVIGEGLIKTHNPEYVVNNLNRFANGNLIALWVKQDTNIGFINISPFVKTEEYINTLINHMNNMGYFLAGWFDMYDNDMEKPNTLVDYNDLFILRFEPKFDVEYNTNNRYLYHVTHKNKLHKILKIGLTPKTNSKISTHPDRIYLAVDKDSLISISNDMVLGGFIKKEDQVFLKIDTQENPLFLMVDGQFKGGVYTTYNIKPEDIEVIDL